MWKDFKEFLQRGNVVDLAVAVVIGAAFGAIVTSLVNDLVMPLIGIIIGKISFTGLILQVGDAQVKYGNFIQVLVNFLIIAFVIFIIVRAYENLRQRSAKPAPVAPPPPPSAEVQLLTEIRDLLNDRTRGV